ncbi:Metallophosphoesterase [Alteracholeplasma palmae J233]|uniref:Metallophosphoesterase n=1 Tax=Alteracholeplasma palmae (strain ATCC 49389 / J233) TaxID=1318466 RepID=U4KKE8_ALTPJ|nr:metallophosphoesterase [Alteracholeplasma palmae]CCV64194.1 Metallophosphoesterase [Alteracholeplasma palmae J233]
MKKYFVFSDAHGNYDAMIEGFKKANFDSENKDHYLVGLGDFFDRGNQNDLVLNYLLEMDRKNKLYAIRGNHDDFLYDLLENKSDGKFHAYYHGLDKTIENLSGMPIYSFFENNLEHVKKIKENYPDLISLLSKMKDHYVIGNYMLTHAGFTENKRGFWEIYNMSNTIDFIKKYPYDDYIQIFGHWHASDLNKIYLNKKMIGEPFIYKNFIGIDACSIKTNKIFILVIELENGHAKITDIIK